MPRQRIVFVYNTGAYLYRLRRELLIELVEANYEVYALFPFDAATAALEELGVRCVPLNMTAHSLSPRREWQALMDVRKKLHRIDPDIVFAFTIKPIVYSGLTLQRHCDIRFCVMITGLGMMFAGRGLSGRIARMVATVLYRRSLKKAKVVFMQNAEHGEAFKQLGLINAAQYQLIAGSGVNLNRFRQQTMPRTKFVFVMITRMLEHKGVWDFIAAARALRRAGSSAEFILAGPIVEGPHSINEDRLARWLDGSPVTYRGTIEDVRDQLARASVVVLPSSYPEGVPRILLEALAVGRPILTTDTAGCRSTVEIPDITRCKYIEKMYLGPESADIEAELHRSGATRPMSSLHAGLPNHAISGPLPTNAHPFHGTIGQNGVLCRPGDIHALISCMYWMTALAWDELVEMGEASRHLVEREFDVRDVNDTIRRRLFDDP